MRQLELRTLPCMITVDTQEKLAYLTILIRELIHSYSSNP